MRRRDELLSKHRYQIYQGKDKKWRTYLPDPKAKTGRVLRKRNTKEEIQDLIVQYYLALENAEKSKSITFAEMYDRWFQYRNELGMSDNTIHRYETDYKRFFQGQDIENKALNEINEEDITVFLTSTIRRLHLPHRSAKQVYYILDNVFHSAKVHRVITDNPMDALDYRRFSKYETVKIKTAEERTVSSVEMTKLYEQFLKDHRKKEHYIPTYAVEFATLTGMRVGEIAALRWDCIKNGVIYVDKFERNNRATKTLEIVNHTKNREPRTIPISPQVQALLDEVKRVEQKYGYLSDYVFADGKGRIKASVISTCAENKCLQAGIPFKSVHAFRRTLSSDLRCMGVPGTLIASMIGHTERTNLNYYTYDTSNDEVKREYLSLVNAKTVATGG